MNKLETQFSSLAISSSSQGTCYLESSSTKTARSSTNATKIFFKTKFAHIVIPYRGHQSLNDGKGMLFDHIRFQFLTNHPTAVSYPEDDQIAEKAKSFFTSVINQHSASLKFGQNNDKGKITPPKTKTAHNCGLLVIPGRVRELENEPVRLAHEFKVIRNALNRGQPILGICAGAWRVWDQLLISTRKPNFAGMEAIFLTEKLSRLPTIIPVTDHSSSSMVRLNSGGINACYNVQMHTNVIVKDSFLEGVLNPFNNQEFFLDDFLNAPIDPTFKIQVNSVHSKAVNPAYLPNNVRISATAEADPTISKKNRHQKLLTPQEKTVEAYESIFGAPILGIQWHPEGYNDNDKEGASNINLLKRMAQAGDAYLAKRKMLSQFHTTRLLK